MRFRSSVRTPRRNARDPGGKLGLLLDAFVVRTLLIPAAIALIGPRAAWPGKHWRERRDE